MIDFLLNFVLHIDQHLIAFVTDHGAWTYALLFAVIFCETALVVTPFLPGDSLLFAAGTISANQDGLNIHLLFFLLLFASWIGNTINYAIGRFIGPKIFFTDDSFFFKRKYLNDANQFYQRHGGKTIVIARFIPIIRTFVPFVAGLANMNKAAFFIYNLVGALLWIGGLLYVSYLFGNLPLIKDNLSVVIMGIIVISLLPPIFAFFRKKA